MADLTRQASALVLCTASRIVGTARALRSNPCANSTVVTLSAYPATCCAAIWLVRARFAE